MDAHHSLEDVGLCLGQAVAEALGDKAGIARVAHVRVPMDEALTEVCIDISGRPYLVYEGRRGPGARRGRGEGRLARVLQVRGPAGRDETCTSTSSMAATATTCSKARSRASALALKQAAALGRDGVLSTKGSLD